MSMDAVPPGRTHRPKWPSKAIASALNPPRRYGHALVILGLALLAVVRPIGSGETAGANPAPPRPLPLAGDLNAHDPAFTQVGQTWFVLNTGDPAINGGTIQIKKSTDRKTFTSVGTVWDEIPAWVKKEVPEVSNLWAPEVFKHGNTYYLYYSASSFGSNNSLIALATNTTLDPAAPGYRWVDRGVVWRSQTSDDYNAIDPGLAETPTGTPYLTFGSFWSGIRQVELKWPSGKPVDTTATPARLVDRLVPPNAVEAPYLVRHRGYYYLFVSFDFCCRGSDSTYKIAVGRSRSITGPFTDQLGTPLQHGGGTVILSSDGPMVGPGGVSVSGDLLAHHFYDADAAGAITLSLRRIQWGANGWPVLTHLH
jgi:arabinan endo-1,5-alpha-L-arabinosidase